MKKYIPVLLMLILPLYYSCVGREQANFVPVTPTIGALNNGQNWQVTLHDTIQNDSLILYAQWKHDILRMVVPTATTPSFILTNGRYYLTNTAGKVINSYKLDDTYGNKVSVLTSTANRSITGQFNLRFVTDSLAVNTDTTALATYTFNNGQFAVPLPK